MSDEQPTEVLSALPRTRPHRRSQRRARPGPSAPPAPEQLAVDAPAGPSAPGSVDQPPAAALPAPTAARKRPTTAGARAGAATRNRHETAGAGEATPADGEATRNRHKTGEATPADAEPLPAATAPPQRAGQPHPRPLRQPAQPQGLPTTPRKPHPEPARGADIFDTAVQAAAELTEIGLTLSARALRNAVARLPRP